MTAGYAAVAEHDLTPAQRLRVLAAFVVQPFAAAALGFVVSPIVVDASGGMSPDGAGMSIAAGAALAAVFVTAFGALPAAAWCVKTGPLTLGRVLAWGAALGNLPFVLIVGLGTLRGEGGFGPEWGPAEALRALAVGALFGVVGAAIFWLIAVRGTPLNGSKGAA